MELLTQKREILGKKVRALRKTGIIPAELYGHETSNLHLSVPVKEFSKIFKMAGESTLIKLKVEGDKNYNVLIHNVEHNALTDEVWHIDFYTVKMDEKIKTKVPVEFVGESPAVKEKSGMLVKAMQEIEIEALPADLPHHISVDISSIVDLGASILIKDIDAIKGVKILVDQETVVATVSEIKEEEVVAPVASVEDVKVEGEEKKKEKEKEKEESEK